MKSIGAAWSNSATRDTTTYTENDPLWKHIQEAGGSIRDLKKNRNWNEAIGIEEAIKMSPNALERAHRRGEITKRGMKQIDKALNRDGLGNRGRGV